jgi:hypothetical protein
MVEIIPKQIVTYPPGVRIAMYIALALFLGSLVSYFLLYQIINSRSDEIFYLKEVIDRGETEQELQLEAQVLAAKKRVDDIVKTLDVRTNSLRAFEFFENKTLPEIYFDSLSLLPKQKSAELEGNSPDFLKIEQQMLVLKQQEHVRSAAVSNILLGEEGGTSFSLSLEFTDELFK